MRVLLDTNIVIHRENHRISNYSIGHLFNWLDKLNCEKIISQLGKNIWLIRDRNRPRKP